jgi:hypothetical protein
MIDPDRWLETVDGTLYTRRVNASGSVQVGKFKYYLNDFLLTLIFPIIAHLAPKLKCTLLRSYV